MSGRLKVDYTALIKEIEQKQQAEKAELLDSIQVSRELIDKQKKELIDIRKKIVIQSKEIEKIKKDYDTQKNNISQLGADDVVSESTKHLSE